MPEFSYQELLPLAADTTAYRCLTTDHVTTAHFAGRDIVQVEPAGLTLLAREAMRDIAHFLRPAHLAQLRKILDDPEASHNDKFVALDLLKNASIAAGGVLPMCQDTGTAIVMGKRGQQIWTDGADEAALARGIYDTYLERNLRYSQLAPLTMYEEKNTGTNLPAQIEIYAEPGDAYKFLFMAKGGGSANKTFLYQETKAVLNPKSLLAFIDDKLRALGTSACPPYHLAIVVGGTSAEYALKTVKLASAHYLDGLPTSGNALGRAFRDVELEAQVFELSQKTGIGAQFGGKYFCHDVRVVRLPRHGASCPIAIGVSCAADRQAKAKINAKGIFIEQLETDPARFLPEVEDHELDSEVVRIDLELDEHERAARDAEQVPDPHAPVAERGADRRARHRARQTQRAPRSRRRPARLRQAAHHLLRGPGQDARRLRVRQLRPHHRGPHGQLRRRLPARRRQHGHARQGQSLTGRDQRLSRVRRLLSGLDRRPGRTPRARLHHARGGARIPRARHGGDLEDPRQGLPRVHRRRRQGQRLLRRVPQGLAADGEMKLLLMAAALLAGCSDSGDGGELASALAGRQFVSESVAGRQLVAGTEIRLRFSDHGELSANAGCNHMSGAYTIDGTVLRMRDLATTEIGCEAALHEQDRWVQELLIGSPEIALDEPRLLLSTDAIRLTLLDRELASPDRPLVGTRWIGNGTGDDQAVSFGPGSALVTIAFDTSDRVEIFTGCQQGSGTFSVDGSTIAFFDLAYDGAPCPDASRQDVSDQVLFALDGSPASFEIEERNLTITRNGRVLLFRSEE